MDQIARILKEMVTDEVDRQLSIKLRGPDGETNVAEILRQRDVEWLGALGINAPGMTPRTAARLVNNCRVNSNGEILRRRDLEWNSALGISAPNWCSSPEEAAVLVNRRKDLEWLGALDINAPRGMTLTPREAARLVGNIRANAQLAIPAEVLAAAEIIREQYGKDWEHVSRKAFADACMATWVLKLAARNEKG